MAVVLTEWEKKYTWGTAIEITANRVVNLLLREENNLIKLDDNEIYCDLQLEDWITTTDTLPVWVTTWRVIEADGWIKSWTMLCFKTTSGDYVTRIYGDDWKLYIDNGTWTFKQIYLKSEVDALFAQLRSEISAVGYSGEYNDLLHKPTLWTAAALDVWTDPWDIPQIWENWRLDPLIIPNVTSHTFVVSDVEDLVTLSQAAQWDMAIVENAQATYILNAEPYSVAANWLLLPTPTSDVTSVNWQRWDVSLTTNNIPVQWTTNMYVSSTEKSGWNAKLGYNDVATVAISGNYEDLSNKPAVDATLSTSSTNAIQNKAVATALNNKQDQHSSITVSLTAAWWSNNSQTVTATGVTSSNSIIVSPAPSSVHDYSDNYIYCSAQGTDSLTFTCDTVPTWDISVNVMILN